jgi:hypothetical protein
MPIRKSLSSCVKNMGSGKDGKIVAPSKSWVENLVILPSRALELQWSDGQVHVWLVSKTVRAVAEPHADEDTYELDDSDASRERVRG